MGYTTHDTRAVRRITYASLKEAFDQNTETVDGSHIHWVGYTDSDGTPRVCYQHKRLAAPRAAFQLHHGRDPIGKPLPTCGVKGCIRGGHLADRPMREASQCADAVRADHRRPVTRPRPTIVCASCRETREHRAHGWCQPCYRRWRYYGRPADGPPPVRLIEHDDVQGTVQGWDLHMRRGTDPCIPCREAHNAAVMDHYRGHGRPRLLNEVRHYSEVSPGWSAADRSAAVAVASVATDADDCRVLLQAIGLLPYSVERCERIGGAA